MWFSTPVRADAVWVGHCGKPTPRSEPPQLPPLSSGMTFTKSGIDELHTLMHDYLNAILDHAATMPRKLLGQEVAGSGRRRSSEAKAD